MALSLGQFSKLLTDSGLISAHELRAFTGSLSAKPADAEALARKLIEARKLTLSQLDEQLGKLVNRHNDVRFLDPSKSQHKSVLSFASGVVPGKRRHY